MIELKKTFGLALVLVFAALNGSGADENYHAVSVFWGTRVNYLVLFNEILYESPEPFSALPLSFETGLRTDETFYFFTFSSYSLSVAARYRILLAREWSVRVSAGYLVSMMPFYSQNSNWIYSAPLAGISAGWNGGVLALEWNNRFGFFLDGLDVMTGLSFSWKFHEMFRLMIASDLVVAVLYDLSRAETALDVKVGFGILLY